MKRRVLSLSALAAVFGASHASAASSRDGFEVTRTEAEWRAMLTDAQYRVMRQEDTERPGTSPLDRAYADGVYHCQGCDQPLYASEHKYDSGTGWPSFFDVLPDAIGTRRDRSFLLSRTECHCDRCGSHLGHIFNDGPAPTGKRHCLNGVSLEFRAT